MGRRRRRKRAKEVGKLKLCNSAVDPQLGNENREVDRPSEWLATGPWRHVERFLGRPGMGRFRAARWSAKPAEKTIHAPNAAFPHFRPSMGKAIMHSARLTRSCIKIAKKIDSIGRDPRRQSPSAYRYRDIRQTRTAVCPALGLPSALPSLRKRNKDSRADRQPDVFERASFVGLATM
jgi:hypothetical protein